MSDKPLTTGEKAKEWNAVLSPDRTRLIYSRQGTGNQLRTMAVDGTGDRPLFDESSVKQCSFSTGRPAWIPANDDLLMRCFGREKVIQIVRLDVSGKFRESYVSLQPGDNKGEDFGHPAVSPDSSTAVLPIGDQQKDREGTLWTIKLATHELHELLVPGAPYDAFGDPVFSPDGTMLVWHATTKLPEGADPTTDMGSEVLAAPFDLETLSAGQLVHISGDLPGDDQDPMFSLDGDQIVYTHSPPDDPATTDIDESELARELWMASVADPSDRHKISGTEHAFYSTPAWSRR